MNDALSDDASDPHDPHDPSGALWNKNRIEALTDGIYAVAMTLLVIDLKVPDPHAIRTREDLTHALFELAPKFGSWVLSFLVLAVFWLGHHRLFHHVRVVDRTLLWRNIVQLMLVSLLPFSASMLGEFVEMRQAQFLYNGNMMLLALAAIWQLGYVRAHPRMQGRRLMSGAYHAALLRNGGLVVAGAVAIAITIATGSVYATYAYLVMWPLGIVSGRIAARDRRSPIPASVDPHAPPHNPPSR